MSLDVQKTASLANLKDVFINKYFPDGINVTSGIHLRDVSVKITNFTGTAVNPYLQSGDDFTVGAYVEEAKSNPIRLYLLTKVFEKILDG